MNMLCRRPLPTARSAKARLLVTNIPRPAASTRWRGRRRALGGSLLLRHALARGTALLGGIFQSVERERRAQSKELPARKRHGGMGMQQLRLHEAIGRTIAATGKAISQIVEFCAQMMGRFSATDPDTARPRQSDIFPNKALTRAHWLGSNDSISATGIKPK